MCQSEDMTLNTRKNCETCESFARRARSRIRRNKRTWRRGRTRYGSNFKYTFYMVKIDTTFYSECGLCIRSVDLDVDLDA